jgi:hypothetical protein
MAAINTTCPRCNAPHAKKLSLIYSDGISTVQSSTQSVGQVKTIGRVKFSTAGTTTGMQQSEASKDAAPPFVPALVSLGTKSKSKTSIYGLVLAFVVAVIIMQSGGSLFNVISGILIVCGLTALVVFCIEEKPSDEETKEYQRSTKAERTAYDKWSKTFACGSCGEHFIPK